MWALSLTVEGRVDVGGERCVVLVKQIEAGVLEVGYAGFGPPGGPTVVLLRGWRYDKHT